MSDEEFVKSHFPNAVVRRGVQYSWSSRVYFRVRVSYAPRRYLCKCRKEGNVWRAARKKITARVGQPGYPNFL